MPNWCSNRIQISGTEKNMTPIFDKFMRWFVDGEFSDDTDTLIMNELVPPDEDYNRIKSEGKFILNPQDSFYGSKWDFSPSDLTDTTINLLKISFNVDTAWSPVVPFVQRLSEKYGVNVHIEYSESGCDFYGKAFYMDGEEKYHEQYGYLEGHYHNDPEYFWGEVEFYLEDLTDTSLETFLGWFKFVDENDVQTLTNMYNEKIKV